MWIVKFASIASTRTMDLKNIMHEASLPGEECITILPLGWLA
jgi:hypothetical protein